MADTWSLEQNRLSQREKMMLGIHTAYQKLTGPSQSECHPESKSIRVGLDDNQNVYIFVEYKKQSYKSNRGLDKTYELVTVKYDSKIEVNKNELSGIKIDFIQDRNESEETLKIFLAAFEEAIQQNLGHQEQPNDEELTSIVTKFLNIFARKAVGFYDANCLKGWWGELFLIYISKQPKIWIEAYHSNAKDPIDFIFPEFNIEVKSFAGQIRKHIFSTSQSRVSENKKTYLASLKLTYSPFGMSFEKLLNDLMEKFPNKACLDKMYEKLKIAKEINPDGVEQTKFEIETATRELLFFNFDENLRLVIKNNLIESAKYTLNLSTIINEGFDHIPGLEN